MNSKKNIIVYYKSILFLLISLVLISFSSCKDECNKCEVRPPDIVKPVIFNLAENSMKVEFEFYKINSNGNNIESLSRGTKDEKLFLLVKNYCLIKNLPINNQTMGIVLYYDCPVSQTFTINNDKISGISIYYIDKKRIKHQLFIKNSEGMFIGNENTKVSVPFISHNHSQFYLNNYVYKSAQNRSYISIMGDLADEVYNNLKDYKRVPFRFEKKTSKGLVGGNNHCGDPCPYGTGWCIEGPKLIACSSVVGPCTTENIQSSLLKENLSESNFINLDLMYSFRDNFLFTFDKGEEYINNYYLLSAELKDNISIPLALKTAVFFSHFNSVMAAFVNPENHLNEIMFTESLTNELLDLLDDYEEIITSSEGKAIISSIRSDINSYRNKSLQEILAMIN
jgi:hypothetical protein